MLPEHQTALDRKNSQELGPDVILIEISRIGSSGRGRNLKNAFRCRMGYKAEMSCGAYDVDCASKTLSISTKVRLLLKFPGVRFLVSVNSY